MKLRTQGKRLFVVSNKPRPISLRILQAAGTLGLFEEIVTRDSREQAYKDKQEMMRSLMERHGLQPRDCLMVGDTMEDAVAAMQTGMQFCLMTHGYGDVTPGPAVPVAFRFDRFLNSCRHGDRSRALIDKDVFEDLFVLEMANNHLGSLERGLKIIQEFSQIVRFNNVRASIKLQFRDVERFIHKDFGTARTCAM